jgi:hypothetical protein
MDAHYGTLGILCAPFANARCNGVSACPVVVPFVGCSCIHSSIEILMIQFNTISLHVIYTLHQQGDVPSAIEHYTSALATIPLNISKGGASNYENTMMVSTLLSNRAMCYLKLFEVQSTASTPEPKQLLLDCINDCTLALDHLETITSSDQSVNTARGKLLYRRAKALLATNTINSTSNATSNITDDTREQNLNSSAKDLLRLLQFNPNNKEAAALLRVVRAQHGSISGGMGRSRIAKVLGVLKSGDVDVRSWEERRGCVVLYSVYDCCKVRWQKSRHRQQKRLAEEEDCRCCCRLLVMEVLLQQQYHQQRNNQQHTILNRWNNVG